MTDGSSEDIPHLKYKRTTTPTRQPQSNHSPQGFMQDYSSRSAFTPDWRRAPAGPRMHPCSAVARSLQLALGRRGFVLEIVFLPAIFVDSVRWLARHSNERKSRDALRVPGRKPLTSLVGAALDAQQTDSTKAKCLPDSRNGLGPAIP